MCTRSIQILAAALSVWLALAGSARGGPAAPVLISYSYGGESIARVIDLPDTAPYFYHDENVRGFVDVGYRYKQVKVMGIPVWNYDGRWCGYLPGAAGYLDLDREALVALASAAGLRVPISPRLPFWHVCGGKLLLVALLLMVRVLGRRLET